MGVCPSPATFLREYTLQLLFLAKLLYPHQSRISHVLQLQHYGIEERICKDVAIAVQQYSVLQEVKKVDKMLNWFSACYSSFLFAYIIL